MIGDEFFDFMVFWELMFGEEDDGFECPLCGKTIEKGTKLKFDDKKMKLFPCPKCDRRLIVNEKEKAIEAYADDLKWIGPGMARPINKFICKCCGKEFVSDVIEVRDINKKIIYYKCKNCDDLAQQAARQADAEYYRKKWEDICMKLDASGIQFPAGELKSQEKFTCKVGSGTVYFYMDLTTISLKAKEKNKAIQEMISLFTGSGIIKDGVEFYKNILYREFLGSTGIGAGVALPYNAADIKEDGVVSVAISKDGVEFDSLDKKPVKIIFMSAHNKSVYDPTGPGSKGGLHLKWLATISRSMKERTFRERLINAQSKEELFQILKESFEAA